MARAAMRPRPETHRCLWCEARFIHAVTRIDVYGVGHVLKHIDVYVGRGARCARTLKHDQKCPILANYGLTRLKRARTVKRIDEPGETHRCVSGCVCARSRFTVGLTSDMKYIDVYDNAPNKHRCVARRVSAASHPINIDVLQDVHTSHPT